MRHPQADVFLLFIFFLSRFLSMLVFFTRHSQCVLLRLPIELGSRFRPAFPASYEFPRRRSCAACAALLLTHFHLSYLHILLRESQFIIAPIPFLFLYPLVLSIRKQSFRYQETSRSKVVQADFLAMQSYDCPIVSRSSPSPAHSAVI